MGLSSEFNMKQEKQKGCKLYDILWSAGNGEFLNALRLIIPGKKDIITPEIMMVVVFQAFLSSRNLVVASLETCSDFIWIT